MTQAPAHLHVLREISELEAAIGRIEKLMMLSRDRAELARFREARRRKKRAVRRWRRALRVLRREGKSALEVAADAIGHVLGPIIRGG